jgi:GNAT superfamily N-acetyltransferase
VPSCQVVPITPAARGFAELLQESRRGGYRMLARFDEAWTSGAGRFDRPGEMILGAFARAKLIGVGGRSIDPYQGDPAVGRIRHLYVAESRRGCGIGRLIVTHILASARCHFTRINVRAPQEAFGFYEHLGFVRAADAETVTHRLLL